MLSSLKYTGTTMDNFFRLELIDDLHDIAGFFIRQCGPHWEAQYLPMNLFCHGVVTIGHLPICTLAMRWDRIMDQCLDAPSSEMLPQIISSAATNHEKMPDMAQVVLFDLREYDFIVDDALPVIAGYLPSSFIPSIKVQ